MMSRITEWLLILSCCFAATLAVDVRMCYVGVPCGSVGCAAGDLRCQEGGCLNAQNNVCPCKPFSNQCGKEFCEVTSFCGRDGRCQPNTCAARHKFHCPKGKGDLLAVKCPADSQYDQCYSSADGHFRCYSGAGYLLVSCGSQVLRSIGHYRQQLPASKGAHSRPLATHKRFLQQAVPQPGATAARPANQVYPFAQTYYGGPTAGINPYYPQQAPGGYARYGPYTVRWGGGSVDGGFAAGTGLSVGTGYTPYYGSAAGTAVVYLPSSYSPLAGPTVTYPCYSGAPPGTPIGPGLPCGVNLTAVPAAALPTVNGWPVGPIATPPATFTPGPSPVGPTPGVPPAITPTPGGPTPIPAPGVSPRPPGTASFTVASVPNVRMESAAVRRAVNPATVVPGSPASPVAPVRRDPAPPPPDKDALVAVLLKQMVSSGQ